MNDLLIYNMITVFFVPIALILTFAAYGVLFLIAHACAWVIDFIRHEPTEAEIERLTRTAEIIAWSAEVRMRTELEWGVLQDKGGYREWVRRMGAKS